MKALATVIALLALAASAPAQSNDVTFKQTQGEDGLYHLDIGVSYGFPRLPPRTRSSVTARASPMAMAPPSPPR